LVGVACLTGQRVPKVGALNGVSIHLLGRRYFRPTFWLTLTFGGCRFGATYVVSGLSSDGSGDPCRSI